MTVDPLPSPASPAACSPGMLPVAPRDRRLFDSLFEGVWERDLSTNAVWYSPRFKELLGFADSELPNDMALMRERIHPDDLPLIQHIFAHAVATLGSADAQVRLRHRDGDWRWFRGRARVWPDDRGRPATLVGALYDVHEQVLATEALQAHQAVLQQRVQERTQGLEAALRQAENARGLAERASAAKASFLAHMSHELRTPLNGMLGMTELAQPLASGAEQRRYLELARQSGLALLRILDDVFDFTRAESGVLQLHDEDFDIAELAAETLRGFMPAMQAKGLEVGFDHIGPATALRGDAGRVRQVLTNLLANATKFTAHGSVVVVVHTALDPDGRRCEVRLTVSDTGIGIDPATLARIFDPFEQADTGIARRHGGAGLGLSVVRLLAGMMGGTVAVQSTPGAGASFEVTLRLARAEGAPAPRTANGGRAATGHAWVLGRSSASGARLQARLARLGWSAELLGSVDAAIDQLRLRGADGAPDCVVIGEAGFTPDTDFMPLCHRLAPGVPVTLLLRPDFDLRTVKSAVERCHFKVLISPMTPADLELLLRPAATAAPPASPDLATVPARRNVLVVEDNLLNQIIAREMVTALGLDAAVVGSGEEAMLHCRATAPDLVLMDIQMPGMDGLETTRQLRSLQVSGELRHFPIIALTAHGTAGDRDASLAAGMDEHLCKPIRIDHLHGVLRQWLALA